MMLDEDEVHNVIITNVVFARKHGCFAIGILQIAENKLKLQSVSVIGK